MEPPVELSTQAISILRELLSLHYVDGGVPLPIIALVEQALRAVGEWFPDPQYPYHPEEGYL